MSPQKVVINVQRTAIILRVPGRVCLVNSVKGQLTHLPINPIVHRQIIHLDRNFLLFIPSSINNSTIVNRKRVILQDFDRLGVAVYSGQILHATEQLTCISAVYRTPLCFEIHTRGFSGFESDEIAHALL